MKRRKGNPMWGRPNPPQLPAAQPPTLFERLLKELGIRETDDLSKMMQSEKLRNWVHKNCHRRYVPEDLLKLMGVDHIADHGQLDF